MLGHIGNLLLLLAFVGSAVALFGYARATQSAGESTAWLRVGRGAWYFATTSVLLSAVLLWILLFSHQFQFSYVWSHTSRSLPIHFLFSSFWAGQEGSFLLWVLYTAVIGAIVSRTARDYEPYVMSIIAVCQVFMISMVVGLHLGGLDIGSSPFKTLAERFPDAAFIQAGGVPPDGQGLNALLQNIWMAIHPPTLFVGFAVLIVPFAYAVAGLWTRRYSDWVKPALPWAIFGNLVLLMGVLMGGYWAYVTLSFGGYWAWDPVENSSLVPWLVGMAGIHAMVIQKRRGSSQRASLVLNILTFMLVVYSTFLTRSGILGDISVHSFVDLGLYNQLLLWIVTMAGIGFGLLAYRYKEVPAREESAGWLTREFLIFTGAMLLCALAGVIILGTSTPIIGRIFQDSPSGVPIEFYNKWTLPVAVGIALLVGLGQLVWWTRMRIETINKVILKPLALAVISTAAVLIFTPFTAGTVRPLAASTDPGVEALLAGLGASVGQFVGAYGMSIMLLLLLFTAFFAFYGNLIVAWRISRGNLRMAGGAISHIGFALMLLGIITSSAFNNPLSQSDEMVRRADGSVGERGNFIIEEGQTVEAEGYRVTYNGRGSDRGGKPTFSLAFEDERGRKFDAEPVAFQSGEMWVQNPYIKTWFEKDLFIAVSPKAMFGEEEASDGQISLGRGESQELSEKLRITFEDFDMDATSVHGAESADISVGARLRIADQQTGENWTVRPLYVILSDRTQHFESATIPELDVTVSFVGMNVDSGSINLVVEGPDIYTGSPDWLLVQAYEKPFINLMWLGSLILLLGMGVSFYRRVREERSSNQTA